MEPAAAPRLRGFRQVDVFTDRAGWGNPLAVVLDGSGLDDAAMQRFAAWTNLSETTFVLPPTRPDCDYRVRIFTPGGELPFAGHPTLGSCHAWLANGGQPRDPQVIVQECGAGPVRIRRGADGRLAFAAPACRRSAPAPSLLAQVARALGLQPQEIRAAQLLDNGPVWLGLLLDSRSTVLALEPDHARLRQLGTKVGVAHLPDDPSAEALTVRAFAAPIGVNEDPVTGSLNASLAQWLIGDGLAPAQYIASQGECLGRAGRVHVARDEAEQVWIGGDVADCIAGQAWL
ncbi:PhzF family phenazine biosynthesis isomerase [Xylophilus rhododendri]|uniref:PhzF family phenazine biosynthesis isomerase n=1 Tax=Xylophilus rhododendri TaxID=2697032 RepID=A0A857J5V0_9BURK|nr:PhzF family phenazine biosynthesis protein [Xylophilus rhododendri]QHI98361.1 PhzF family phenazine biosynthesis isomerase [Xylophilus rhododendri]